ncbi:MAG TPA: hypothetical protein VGM03_12465 [Phycisphaerae bacterium]|jgi:hypothetical protein
MSKIRLANHKGDEVIATFDPGSADSVQVAQGKLTEFLDDCVRRFGPSGKPPVWARRSGRSEFELFDGKLEQTDEILLQYPLVGG